MGERLKFETVDEYMSSFNGETREALEQLRALLKGVFVGSQEIISYNIPAFKGEHGFMMYFSGYSKHVSISFVPTGPVYEKFSNQLKPYVKSKSTIQFPLSQPLPLDLIREIAEFRQAQMG